MRKLFLSHKVILTGALLFTFGLSSAQDSSIDSSSSSTTSSSNTLRTRKPDNWAIGLNLGSQSVIGDTRSTFPGFGLGLNVRKSFGHTFSARAIGTWGNAFGRDDFAIVVGQLNAASDALNGTNNANANYSDAPFVYNYKTNMINVGLQGVFSVNNLNFFKRENKWNLYLFAGPNFMSSLVRVDALDANGNAYDFRDITLGGSLDYSKDASGRRADLKNIFDGDYETFGHGYTDGKRKTNFGVSFGGGVEYKISRRVALGLETTFYVQANDYLDSRQLIFNIVRPNGGAPGGAVALNNTTDFDNVNFTSLNLSFRLGKSEDALWWVNPLAAIEDDIADNKKRIKDATTDTDGDGVADIFDKEPNTPAGATVDSKGVTLDSDEDGIPDYKDNEPFSPKGAIVDDKGVTKAYNKDTPVDPNDWRNPYNPNSPYAAKGQGGGNWYLPYIHFDLDKDKIKPEFYPQLKQVAEVMKMYPDMKVLVSGHTDIRASSKYNMDLSRRRAENAVKYLSEVYGISKDRLIVDYQGKDLNLVPNLPLRGKENAHYINRRVEFSVYTK